MEHVNLYPVQKQDIAPIKNFMAACFMDDPLFETLMPCV